MIRQSRTVALTLDAVRAHRAALEEIGKRYGVRNIRVFGSVARGEADTASDLDLLVDVLPGHGLLALSAFATDVEDTLHVLTQVSTLAGIKPRIRARIVAEAVPV
jgi:predicted nucleotidyltransferase